MRFAHLPPASILRAFIHVYQSTFSNSTLPGPPTPTTAPTISYERESVGRLLAQANVLAVIGFGLPDANASTGEGAPDRDPRVLRLGMQPVGEDGDPRYEVWWASSPVSHGRSGDVRHASDGSYSFVAIEIDEAAHGGLAAATGYAYSKLLDHVAASPSPHVLRLWNYLDAINLGDGDDERYRHFCSGRTRGIGEHFQAGYPAATAIGRRDGRRVLQVYGLTGVTPGRLVENPRQVSAWCYPRQYGPVAPAFARAMRDPSGPLLISGTAAVVGHASLHPGDIDAQLEETIQNLHSLLHSDRDPLARLGSGTLLKVYVRDPAYAERVAATLRTRLPGLDDLLMLCGDICRRDLLVEIDGVHV